MKFNGGRSRDEILAEVESVRSDMDSTLTAIERKLTPGQLVDQGLEYLRNSGAREYFSNLGISVKQNPIPVALAGISIAWLMASGRNARGNGGDMESAGERFRRAGDTAWSGARSGTQQARRTLNDATEAARERFDQARQSVSGTAQSMRERIEQARESVSGTAQSARETLSRGAHVAQRQLARARGGYDWMLREQPLALGAIGVAIGALFAAAAPRTRAEDKWMGEASDELANRAKEAGREQLERAGDALRSATSPQDGGGTGQGEKLQGAMQGASGAGSASSAPGHAESWPYSGGQSPQAAGQVTSEPGTEGVAPARDESTQEPPGGRPPRQ